LPPYGIVASPVPLAPAPPDAAVIRRERYVVTVPPCPDWSKPAIGAGDFTNTASSNYGCATATNLGLMVATRADLVEARQAGLTDAHPAAEAVNNYRLGKVQLPAAANIGPIAAPAGLPPPTPAAAGSGGSGAQP
jgi:type IV pilus biogenesis protein CpaD/CtpE